MFYILIKQSAFLFSFLLFGYVVGRSILRNFSFSSPEERSAFSIAAGWAGLALLMMFLGLLGWFRPHILFPVLLLFFSVCLYSIFRNRWYDFKCPIKLIFPVSIFLILLFYVTAYPVTSWDALSYHLPVAKEFISQGKILPMPFLRFPVQPQLVDMFFSLALMSGETLFANLIQYAMAVALFLLVYSFGQRYLNKKIALYSAILFLSSPFILEHAITPYAEMGATLFCFSAFYAMYIWLNERKMGYAILSAIYWGLAFGCKYYSLLFFFTSILAAFILFNKKIRIRQAAFLMLLAALIAFPWYFRNWAYTGDWFFPMRAITGIWHSTDVSEHMNFMRSIGAGRDLKSFFMLPINLLRYSAAFQGYIGLLVIGMGSLFFIKRWSRPIGLCMTITTIYIVFWFCSFQDLRYLFPVFPLLSLCGGWALRELLDRLNVKSRWPWTLLMIATLLVGISYCIRIIKEDGPIPVTAGQKYEYIAERIPTFKAIDFLNNAAEKDETVYALYDEGSVFYYKNKVIGDWFGRAAYKKVSPYINKPDLLYKVLADYGVRYFLINRNRAGKIGEALFETRLFKLIYSDKNAYLFIMRKG